MALIPHTRYPAQTDVEASTFPHGRARNAGSYQDGTGTPLEKDWVNDLWGFQQALLDEADITPSGSPDEVGASQYLDALVSIASMSIKVACYSFSNGAADHDEPFTLISSFQRGGFTMAGNAVTMPSPGRYLALMTGTFRSSNIVNPKRIGISFAATGGAGVFTANALTTRFSDSADDYVHLSLLRFAVVPDDPAHASEQNLQVRSATDVQMSGNGALFILGLTQGF